MSHKISSNLSPPWQVLVLVANQLDPKTLAIASCVCKSWSISFSSDHLWQPICAAQYPSLSTLRAAANAAVSYRKLYALGYMSEKRRVQKPPKPHLSLQDIMFAIDIHNTRSCIVTSIQPGGELEVDKNGVFRFDIDIKSDKLVAFEALDSLRITWNVVMNGFESVFTMMDCKGKGNFVLGLEGWFSKELPLPGCCSSGGASGLVADLRLGLTVSGGRVVVEKMSVGVLSVVSWRYVWVDDVLRYLQHFLLP
ncbi:putative F-box protein [Abeliophyllum distichum]|uniref:F-box protein n=1 Tax=Abeliophyllum distichum TaxID=126358 RepID=A0ABD1VCE4_9LAMI